MKFGFDNELYTKRQTEEILRRIEETGSRLYLEFGGKLFDDCHASRVLPGFDVNAKVKILQKLKDKAEIIIAINARDLEKEQDKSGLRHQLRFRRIETYRQFESSRYIYQQRGHYAV